MTAEELAEMVLRMRKAQSRYFEDRTPTALRESRDLERRVDAAIRVILNPPPPTLFDGGEVEA